MNEAEIRAAAEGFLAAHVSTRPAAEQAKDARRKGWAAMSDGDAAGSMAWFAVAEQIEARAS